MIHILLQKALKYKKRKEIDEPNLNNDDYELEI